MDTFYHLILSLYFTLILQIHSAPVLSSKGPNNRNSSALFNKEGPQSS